ncbi:MAG: rhodanese-like domain-containing protein [Thermoplasmatota archaeon]
MASRDPRESRVLQVPAAEPREAESYFLQRLSVETDPSDVHFDLARGTNGFVLVDCRPTADYAAGHVPGAVNLPYASLSHESTAKLSTDVTYVVYDAGLFDNACTKSALRMAALGFRVKEMMGGLAGWRAEGYPVAIGTAAGKVATASKAPVARIK